MSHFGHLRSSSFSGGLGGSQAGRGRSPVGPRVDMCGKEASASARKLGIGPTPPAKQEHCVEHHLISYSFVRPLRLLIFCLLSLQITLWFQLEDTVLLIQAFFTDFAATSTTDFPKH